MKKIFYICYLAFAAVLMQGCGDWLELMPEDSTIEEEFWQNGNQVESVVRACYRYMQEDDVMQRIVLWGELRSDEVQNGSAISTAETDIVNANVKSSNGYCNWASFYRVINYCNKVIERAPSVRELDANFSEVRCQSFLAEAYTLRALCYFYLVRTFREVPFVTTSSKTDNYDYNTTNRDTLAWIKYYNLNIDQAAYSAEAYPMADQEHYIVDRMIEDLRMVVDYAAVEWNDDAESKGRVTRAAVQALLADYYLWRASINHTIDPVSSATDYRNCIALCNTIEHEAAEREEMQLVLGENMIREVFYNGNSTESIFELNFNSTGHANNGTANLYGNSVKSKNPHLLASPRSSNLYNTNKADALDLDYDYRCRGYFEPISYRIFKYEGQTPPGSFEKGGTYTYRGSSSQSNWIFYRLSDVHLMKAEALAQIATTTEELDVVVTLCNLGYRRACTQNGEVKDSIAHEPYTSPSEAQKLVLDERKRELMFEGKRWFDLLRLARRNNDVAESWSFIEPRYDEDVTTIKNKMASIGAWYLPIYSSEMKINVNLRQNEYYKLQEE